MSISERIIRIKKNFPSILILAATKGRTLTEAQAAISGGVNILGENYVQEAEKKYSGLKEKRNSEFELHLIGHLQRNKVKRALAIFDMVQSVDSFELAREINFHAKKKFPILIQVNIGREPQKSGCLPEDASALAKKISGLGNVRVLGLMAMAPHSGDSGDSGDPEDSRAHFRTMGKLFTLIKRNAGIEKLKNVRMEILSMGMSHDYRIAIEEGANMVRLGKAVFGAKR